MQHELKVDQLELRKLRRQKIPVVVWDLSWYNEDSQQTIRIEEQLMQS